MILVWVYKYKKLVICNAQQISVLYTPTQLPQQKDNTDKATQVVLIVSYLHINYCYLYYYLKIHSFWSISVPTMSIVYTLGVFGLTNCYP